MKSWSGLRPLADRMSALPIAPDTDLIFKNSRRERLHTRGRDDYIAERLAATRATCPAIPLHRL